jgi:hypothetical protein
MAKEKDGEESISCTARTTSTSYSMSEGHIEEKDGDSDSDTCLACHVRDSLDVQRQVYDGEEAKRREKKGIKGWVRGTWYGVLEKWG